MFRALNEVKIRLLLVDGYNLVDETILGFDALDTGGYGVTAYSF